MYYDVDADYLLQMMEPGTRRRITGTIGDLVFSDSDIIRESFEVSNRCAEESGLKIGGVYIGQLNMTFAPSFLEKLGRKKYVGKVVAPSIGLRVNGSWEDVPVGVYTIKTAQMSKQGMYVEAFDNMQKFDKPFNYVTSYGTAYDLLRLICQDCGVELGITRSFVESRPNGQEVLYLVEDNDIETYRDFLYWIAQTVACFATMNRTGKLVLRNFGLGTSEIDPTHRDVDAVFSDFVTKYTAISMYDNDAGKDQYYSVTPNNGATMNLGPNPLLQMISDADEQAAIAYLEGQIQVCSDRIDFIDDQIDALDEDIAEVEEELHEHPDDPELLQRLAELNSQKDDLQKLRKDVEDEKKGYEQELEDLREGIEDRSKVFKKRARRAILAEVVKIQYMPFSVTAARDPIFDLGDLFYFSGGMPDNETGCIMFYSYKIDSFAFEGYGDNPALADSRSKTDKSVSSVKKAQDKGNKIEFVEFINAATINITQNSTRELGRVAFAVGQTSDVETWIELKMRVTPDSLGNAGILITFYLDGEEITAYHPVQEWKDQGMEPSFDYDEDTGTVIFDSEREEDITQVQTINFHYHLRNVLANDYHFWRVTATGINGVEFIDTGCCHILLWAQGMKEQDGFIGLIQAQDTFPLYPIKGLDLFGDISDTATVTTEV